MRDGSWKMAGNRKLHYNLTATEIKIKSCNIIIKIANWNNNTEFELHAKKNKIFCMLQPRMQVVIVGGAI